MASGLTRQDSAHSLVSLMSGYAKWPEQGEICLFVWCAASPSLHYA